MRLTYIKKIPFLGKKAVQLYSSYLRLTNKKYLRLNRALQNIERGKRIFILATGPSIKTQDLMGLAGELCISVSNFFVHPDFRNIKPKYHVFAASHPPITDGQLTSWFRDAETHFPSGQKVLVSITDKHLLEKNSLFKKQDVHYYSLARTPLSPDKEINFGKQIPSIQTVAHIAMYLALYIGCKEIYLLGFDHDWILHLGETKHFYDEKQSSLSAHGYDEWSEKDLELEFQSHVNLWQIYKRIKKYATARTVSITNSSENTLLDVFPRKKLSDVLQQEK